MEIDKLHCHNGDSDSQSRITFVVAALHRREHCHCHCQCDSPHQFPSLMSAATIIMHRMHNIKDDAANSLLEHETLLRPSQWVDRLVDGTPPQRGGRLFM